MTTPPSHVPRPSCKGYMGRLVLSLHHPPLSLSLSPRTLSVSLPPFSLSLSLLILALPPSSLSLSPPPPSTINVYTCRKTNCINCCSRWWINIDGSECSNYESIETSIRSSTAVDIFVPTTLTGVCYESGDLPISTGAHQITLMVGNCPGSPFTNAASGLFSTSRLIVEEIPRRKHKHWKVEI